LGLRIVAWISVRSTFTDDIGASFHQCNLDHSKKKLTAWLRADFVQEFVKRLTDALEPSRLGYRQIRTGDVPGIGGDLVLNEPVLYVRVVNSRPSLEIAEHQVHGSRDLCHEVVDIGVPLAIVGGGEEQLRVVIEKHEAHIVERADYVGSLEVALHDLQQAAESFCAIFSDL